MRLSSILVIFGACAAAAIAHAQTAATAPAAARAVQRPHSPATPGRRAASGAKSAAGAAPGPGVLSLGTTDITGNKELPKVMVIVPWKGAADAGGVVAPTDSLLSRMLGPVDRGAFQRRIRYYGQLNAAAGPQPAAQVAPVGDSH